MRERLRLLPFAAPFGHPLAPFVVGEDGGQDDHRTDKDEDDLHQEDRTNAAKDSIPGSP